MEKCTKCEAKVVKAALHDTIKLAGVRFAGTVAGWRCVDCGAEYYDGLALARLEQTVAARLLDAGIHSAEVFRFARKSLGLRAAELGELLNVRPETLSRWETGERRPDPRAAALLGAMVCDRLEGRDDTAQRLRATRAPTRLPKRIDLDASVTHLDGE